MPNPAMAKANKASNAARRRIIERHQHEYNQFLAEEREKLGLPANPKQAAMTLALEKAEKRVADLKRELGQA